MGIMMLFWIAIACFIELNIRRKSKVFNKIYEWMTRQLFETTEHHKTVLQRKKSHSLIKKSKSMRMYSEASKSRHNLLSALSPQKLTKKSKSSRFSQSVPFIEKRKELQNRSLSTVESEQSPLGLAGASHTSNNRRYRSSASL